MLKLLQKLPVARLCYAVMLINNPNLHINYMVTFGDTSGKTKLGTCLKNLSLFFSVHCPTSKTKLGTKNLITKFT